MPNPELFAEFIERESNALEITMSAAAGRTTITINEFVQMRLGQGSSLEAIRADLLRDLQTGGRFFGEFRTAVRSSAHASLGRLRDDALFQEEGIDLKYRWVAIMVRTCPDCIERHNFPEQFAPNLLWEEWEVSGLPRTTGTTVCNHFCNCMLIPATVVEVEEADAGTKMEPIMRGRR